MDFTRAQRTPQRETARFIKQAMMEASMIDYE